MGFRISRTGVLTTLGILVIAGGAILWSRFGPARATAKPQASSPAAVASEGSIPTPAEASDYSKRVVAYIFDSIPITRRDLGEYLIARYGVEHIDKMVSQYVIERAAAQEDKVVTAAEVEADVLATLTEFKMNKKQLVEIVKMRYGKTFEEWKVDVVKHRLMLTKLCRDRVTVSEEELRRGFDSTCGDKIRARVIIWPKETADAKRQTNSEASVDEEHEKVLKEYAKIRDSEDEFDRCSRQQKDEGLASKGGEMELYHNFASSPEIESTAFALKPGELSQIITTPDSWMVIKCIEHLPGVNGFKFEDVREDIRREAINRKLVKVEFPRFLAELKEKSHPQILFKKEKGNFFFPSVPEQPTSQVVAMIYDTIPITREQLGEWLIARYGVDEIESLVNRRIVECAAKEKGVELTPAEIDADLKQTLKGLNVNLEQLEKTLLKPHGRTLFGWREDEVTRLALTRLCRDRVQVKENEIQNAYTAYYGEKIQARIILWPIKEQHVAMALYPKIRDSSEEFDRVARTQADPNLSANGGAIEPFGRYTTGNEEMERAAFNLQPGEVSHLVGTPEGFVVIKCVKRIPPQTQVKLEDVRAQLTNDYISRRIRQAEIPKLCMELHEQAHPKIIIKKETAEDLKREVRRDLSEANAGPRHELPGN